MSLSPSLLFAVLAAAQMDVAPVAAPSFASPAAGQAAVAVSIQAQALAPLAAMPAPRLEKRAFLYLAESPSRAVRSSIP